MKILVVQMTTAHIRLLTSTVLSSGGHDVVEASTGKDALEAVATAHPTLLYSTWFFRYERLSSGRSSPIRLSAAPLWLCTQGSAPPAKRRQPALTLAPTATSSRNPNSELLARVNALLRIKKAEDALGESQNDQTGPAGKKTNENWRERMAGSSLQKNICLSACASNNYFPTFAPAVSVTRGNRPGIEACYAANHQFLPREPVPPDGRVPLKKKGLS